MIRLSLQLQSINNFHDDVILTSALRSYICFTMVDFPSDKYTFDCKYVTFCIKKKKDINFTNILIKRSKKIVIGVNFTFFTRFNS